jgi:ethanolamine transporter EutH
MADQKMQRVFGGSPGAVVLKLLFLSLIVGAVMALLDISPRGLFQAIRRFVEGVLDMGTDAIWQVGEWALAGALVVIPIWLLVRLFSRR